jgi:GNAT superfamily N-acetyltransferase
MKIRPVDPDLDAADIAALIRETNPLQLVDADEWRNRTAVIPERMRLLYLVAEVDGRVVADAQGSFGFFAGTDNAFLNLRVLPAHRRHGIGGALYERVRDHVLSLGSSEILAMFDENDEGVAFARARGFDEVRAEQWAVLDPRTVREEPAAGVELVPASELDPRELHRVDEETTRDMPLHAAIDEIPYDEWLKFVWEHPFFTREGSFGALVDGRLAGVTLLLADPASGRGTTMMTGTLASFRGRGVALALKLASAHWAARTGITQLATTNDETNAAMLAVNRRLGYRPAFRRVEVLAQRERLLRERGEHL